MSGFSHGKYASALEWTWWRVKIESPPRFGLGIILGLLGHLLTCIGLYTKLWVQSLGTI